MIAGQPVFGDQRGGPLPQHVAITLRQVGAPPVQLAVAADQFGMGARQPGHEPSAGRAAQVQTENRHAAAAGRRDLAEQPVEMLDGIGEIRQHRRDHHMTVQPRGADRADQTQPGLRGGRAGLDVAVQLGIPDRQRHRDRHRDLRCGVGDQRQVAAQQGALGQDRERRTRFGQGADDGGHQRVAPLGPLVGIGVGAQGDGLALPRRAAQFAAQHLGHVGLDDDLGVKVVAAVQLQIFVGGPGEAVPAGMRAAAVAVDRIAKRQGRRVRHLVQRGLAQHLVKGDPLELRRAHAADETDTLQPRQRPVLHRLPVDRDGLVCPPHPFIRTSVRDRVKRRRLIRPCVRLRKSALCEVANQISFG